MQLAHRLVLAVEVHYDQIGRTLFSFRDGGNTIVGLANGITGSQYKIADGIAHGDVVIDN